MDQENITFSKNQGKSYTMTNLHILGYNTSSGYEDSYNCYDIDVNKILLLKKSDQKYFVRYNDVNKNRIVPLQVEINIFLLANQIFLHGLLKMPLLRQILEAMIENCRDI